MQESEQDGVVFLYQIGQGGVDRSYGIEVARLAGIPGEVVSRAKEILKDLEGEKIGGIGQDSGLAELGGNERIHGVISVNEERLVDVKSEELKKFVGDFSGIDLNNITPLEALNKLSEAKKRASELNK